MASFPSAVDVSKQTQPNYEYRWQNSAVYVSADGGRTWQLLMYFPQR
jgi:hypothetical protein